MKLAIYKRLNFHLHKFHTRTCFFQGWEPCRLCYSWHRLVRHSLDIVRHRTVRFVPVWRDKCITAVQHICVPWLLGAKTLANSILSDVWCFLKAYWSSLYRSFLATFILLTLFTMLQWRDGSELLMTSIFLLHTLPCKFDRSFHLHRLEWPWEREFGVATAKTGIWVLITWSTELTFLLLPQASSFF